MRIEGNTTPQVNQSSELSQKRNVEIKNEQENVKQETRQEKVIEKKDKEVSKEELSELIKSLNEFMDTSSASLEFKFHEKLDEYYAQIIDKNTKQVIREIPPKKMLDIFAAMKDYLGLLIDKRI